MTSHEHNRLKTALETTGLTVHLQAKCVLQNVNLQAEYGKFLAIAGPNGSGKTTLLRALVGVVAYSGAIRIAGTELGELDLIARAKKLAYLPQRSELNASLKCLEVVALGLDIHRLTPGTTNSSRSAAQHALAKVGARHLEHLSYCHLSGGEQRLVLLARALATGSRLILLDEPTSFLDVQHALRLHATLQELRSQGYCIVAVLHDLDEVWRYADQALLLRQGRVLALGPPSKGDFAQSVEQAYGVKLMPNSRLGSQLKPPSP